MFFTIHKLESRVEALEWLRYHKGESLFPLKAYNDLRGNGGDEVVQAPAIRGEEFTVDKNSALVGRDRYTWVEKDVIIPIVRPGFDIVGVFDFGKTGGGNNSGFESLLYVDDVEYQGVDMNHKEVFFNDDYSGKQVNMKFLLWSGLEGGGDPTDQIMLLKQAELGYLHNDTDELFYLSRAICEVIRGLEDTNPIKEKLSVALENFFKKVNIYDEKEEFYRKIEAEYPVLLEELENIGKDSDVTVYCVGHTHIDVAWLWRIKHTKEKALRSFSSVLRLMDKYDDYKFIQSQPQLYKYVKENYPNFYERMKERIIEGRFEANGGMWVEADCNLSSGEALIRQFLYGIRFFQKEFDITSTYLWLPDVFGYSWALPQILKGCNLDTFMTTKISWNEYNKIPHDTFNWRGIDGTEILTHFITTPEEGGPEHYKYFTYNGLVDGRTVPGIWENYMDKGLNQDLLISYGYGDGGGGPNREMIMNRKVLDKIPGIPHVKESTAKEYFNKLHENIEKSDKYIHSWVGELYFENHRGTYTSQAYNKLMNRKMEYYTQHMESLITLGHLLGFESDKKVIDTVWETILTNQFHDIIPGSSITEVYQDCRKDYTAIKDSLDSLKEKYNEVLVDNTEDKYSFFNFIPFERNDIVFIKEKRRGKFLDNKGVELLSEKQENGYKVYAKLIPTGFTTISFKEDETTKNEIPFTVTNYNKAIETLFYTVEFNDRGAISRIFDKENNREVLKGLGNSLTAHEDIPIEFDAWNVDIDHLYNYENVENLATFEVESIGELELSLKVRYNYNKSVINQRIKLYSNDRRIDFETNVDWRENHKFLKVGFDVNVFSSKATYDIQFGNLERTTHFSSSWDYSKFEVVAHKWIDLSETGYGVSLMNDCKYGHSVKDSLMSISLIKCATWPDTKADQGEHNFKYSILPHKGTWQEAGIHKEAEIFNQEPYMFKGNSELSNKSLFKISTENITVDAMKLAEEGDGVILRLHEYMGMRNSFEITSDFKIEEYTPVNLLEEAIGETIACNVIKDEITPYKIKTYKIKLSK